jgi:hypothetical protein
MVWMRFRIWLRNRGQNQNFPGVATGTNKSFVYGFKTLLITTVKSNNIVKSNFKK